MAQPANPSPVLFEDGRWPASLDSRIGRLVLAELTREIAIPAGAFNVRVQQGCVTLAGAVDWHFQRIAAGNCAARIFGVSAIRNLVEVAPPMSFEERRDRAMARIRATMHREHRIIHERAPTADRYRASSMRRLSLGHRLGRRLRYLLVG